MDRWIGKVALVTGASVGIGAQITRALVQNGMIVVAIARRLDKLKELATSLRNEFNGQVHPLECDVREEKDILKVFKWTEEQLGGVDVLINNAGVLVPEPIIEGSTDNFRKILDVNILAVAICARELVQSVKRRNASGHIININSLVGHFAENIITPISLYSASKYAVTGMTLCLRNELMTAKVDIKITSISPGAVKTEMMTQHACFSAEILQALPMIEDKDVADAVIFSLSTPHNTQICEIILKAHEGMYATSNPRPYVKYDV